MHELKCARVRSRGASSAAVAATNEAVAEEAVDAVDDGEVGDGEINESGLESSDAIWASQRHHGRAHVSDAAYGRRGMVLRDGGWVHRWASSTDHKPS